MWRQREKECGYVWGEFFPILIQWALGRRLYGLFNAPSHKHDSEFIDKYYRAFGKIRIKTRVFSTS